MELSERIKALVEFSGLNVTQFANRVGFSTAQAVRELIKGKTKSLSYKSLNLILGAFPEISKAWLTSGEGEMLKSVSQNANNITGHNVCGVNVNGRDIDIKCPSEYETLLDIVRAHNEVVARMQDQLDKSQIQLDKAQTQIDELLAIIKTKL